MVIDYVTASKYCITIDLYSVFVARAGGVYAYNYNYTNGRSSKYT